MTANALRAESPPTPGAPEKPAVRGMFDRIAPRYDLLNRLLSGGIDRGWRRAAVDRLALPRAGRVLDVCSGTADLLVEAVARDASASGVGVDLSLEMLRRGRAKLQRLGLLPRARLLLGDSERLPVRDGTFDGALVGFGIRNVSDPSLGLREIRRALRPGARLVVLEFSQPAGVLGALYRAYSRHLLPRVGRLVSGDATAYSYLPESIARFPGPEAFAELMRGAGFSAVSHGSLTAGVVALHVGTRPV